MNKLSKLLLASAIIISFSNIAQGMETSDKEQKSSITTKYRELGNLNVTDNSIYKSPSIVQLEEGTDNEEVLPPLSMSARFGAYAARCATIGCTTFVGGVMGFGIMSGQVNPEIAYELVKGTAPVLIGSTIGYAAGWGGGNLVKHCMNRRR